MTTKTAAATTSTSVVVVAIVGQTCLQLLQLVVMAGVQLV